MTDNASQWQRYASILQIMHTKHETFTSQLGIKSLIKLLRKHYLLQNFTKKTKILVVSCYQIKRCGTYHYNRGLIFGKSSVRSFSANPRELRSLDTCDIRIWQNL